MENHHFQWENPLFPWPFSIAMLNYQRVAIDECSGAYGTWKESRSEVRSRRMLRLWAPRPWCARGMAPEFFLVKDQRKPGSATDSEAHCAWCFFFFRYGKWFQHSIISGCGTMAFTLTKDGKMEIWVKVSEVKNQECRPRFLPRKLANQAQPIMVKKPRKRTGERNWRFGLQGSLVRFPTLSYSYWILV